MKTRKGGNVFRWTSKCLVLCVSLWFFSGNSETFGARIAGEEGVSPAVTGDAGKEGQNPEQVAAPAKSPAKGPVFIQKETEVQKGIAVQEAAPEDRYVTIDFDNVDIAIFIKFMSEMTGRNFVIDDAVRGKVTIISPTRISVKEAYKVFESVLEVHGFTTVQSGDITKIIPAAEARTKDIETRFRDDGIGPGDNVVTQLIPLRYADPNELKKLLSPLVSKNSVIVSYPPTGMLIITDVLSNINRLLGIIKVIDVEGIAEEISVIPLEYATASDMAKSLNSVFKNKTRRGTKGMTSGPSVGIAADDRTNVLIISASEDDTSKIKKLIRLLDKAPLPGEGSIRVYYLQNANARDLAGVLKAIPSKQASGKNKGKTPVLSKDIGIAADSATNSLIITAQKDDYLVLEDVIKRLDITRSMVYIEALIMEVSTTKDFELGVEWRAGEKFGSVDGKAVAAFGASAPPKGLLPSVDATTGVLTGPTGLALGILGDNIQIGDIKFPSIGAIIRAYKYDSDVHILSTPQIMTTDNEEAEIYVGKNIPYLTRKEESPTDPNRDYSSYEYKDVGITLNITPQINQERFVRLQLAQEVSQVVEAQSESGLPTTLKRVAKTTVVIRDGHTIVIGGLIDETLDNSDYKVPCLGNIPLIGRLFRSTVRSGEKTNLFIFLTPHIIENPAEAEEVYQEKKEQIDTIREGVIKMNERPLAKPNNE
ncbi:MAG: type II secretion system secretin GspD [Desulfobacterales bacterium]|nr:type II secretion system secretin GspD [Desulfobacterales bacterium]